MNDVAQHMPPTLRLRLIALAALVLLPAIGTPQPAMAAGNASATELMGLNLRQLMNVTVTSPSKRDQKYYSTAAALFVITQDDIRRSGARSIPEALRLAPGVNVQQINANQYSISIRGQNDLFSNKLLVLMDGRPVYTPTFSGVWWPALNYPLQDIDRIEVLRGPSGAVWGANAVNGVINIITKDAHDTRGLMISGGTGSHEKGFGTIRAAGSIGHAAYRIYGMREKRDGYLDPSTSQRSPDHRKFDQGGFRLDWDKGDTHVSLHGDSYQVKAGAFGVIDSQLGSASVPYTSENLYSGRNLVMKLQDSLTTDTQLEAQAFYDQYTVSTPFYGERRDTYDLDLQLNLSQLPYQLVSLGYDFRSSYGNMTNTPVLQLPSQRDVLHSYFLNDDIRLMDRLHLILGAKVERNRYSNWQTEPNARMIYSADTWALWAAYSQAVRVPDLVENGISFNAKGLTGTVVRLLGTGLVRPEKVESYEAGYRFFPDDNTLLQATVFQMNYRGVSDAHLQAANAFIEGGYLVVPSYLMNLLDGRVIGVEGDFTYRFSDWGRIKGTISYMDQVYWPNPINDAEAQSTAFSVTQKTPRLQYTAGLSLDPITHVEMDVNLYHFDAFRWSETGKRYDVQPYTRLDARIGWRPSSKVEIDLIGKNLLQQTHTEEINNFLEYASLIEQSYLCMATIRY
ncbi:MAG TPA: TonB-dependent receptor [Mariprofundaceae bacterium]|nr:TonB-dependent receptor [Mariprofundaceae bacterium]